MGGVVNLQRSILKVSFQMNAKLVRCGSKSYFLDIITEKAVAVFVDNARMRGFGTRLGRAGSLEDALVMIREDAGSKRLVIQDCP